MYALFPHAARTFEGLGQGWVTYQTATIGPASSQLTQAVDAAIRFLGIRRRHTQASFYHPGT